MSKEQNKKLTLAELVAKKKQREKEEIKIGTFYCEKEDAEFTFKKLEEEEFFYMIDKYGNALEKDSKISETIEFMNALIYHCVLLEDNKKLSDKEVREILGVTDNKDIINKSAKALIDSFKERIEFGAYILEFSDFSDKGNKNVEEIKN